MEGLGSGGDDYICKPFGIGELRARVCGTFAKRSQRKNHMQWKFQEYVLIWRERVFRWGKRKFL